MMAWPDYDSNATVRYLRKTHAIAPSVLQQAHFMRNNLDRGLAL
jgi:hypothetical protein